MTGRNGFKWKHFAPEFILWGVRWYCRYTIPHLRKSTDSFRIDETYMKVKGRWKYLYRAVDTKGNTLDFLLTAKRDKKAAKRFFKRC